MSQKRYLFKKALEEKLAEKGLNIPLSVESFIVFSAPKGMRFNIDDQYRREKWCFRTGLTKKIEYYIGFSSYTEEQLAQLDEILGNMESQVKRFALTVNFDEVRRDIAEAMVLVSEKPVKKVTPKKATSFKDAYDKKELARRTVAMIAGTVASVAGAGVVLGLTFLGNRKVS